MTEDIPIIVVMRGMGVETDQEIVELIGSHPMFAEAMIPSLTEANALGVKTQTQALEYLSNRIRSARRMYGLAATRKGKVCRCHDNR